VPRTIKTVAMELGC